MQGSAAASETASVAGACPEASFGISQRHRASGHGRFFMADMRTRLIYDGISSRYQQRLRGLDLCDPGCEPAGICGRNHRRTVPAVARDWQQWQVASMQDLRLHPQQHLSQALALQLRRLERSSTPAATPMATSAQPVRAGAILQRERASSCVDVLGIV